MLPTAAEFGVAVGKLGISERDTLVIYDEGNQFSAPRGWWTFRNFGARHVYVLDEGLNGWAALGQALETGPAQPGAADVQRSVQRRRGGEYAASGTGVGHAGANSRRARRAALYAEAPEPRPGLHRGHIPGSINIPYGELLENGRFKSLEALRQTFSDKGVDINGPIITSCGSGVTAAVLAFGLLSLGAPQVKLYDGAWSEWGQLSGKQPIAKD